MEPARPSSLHRALVVAALRVGAREHDAGSGGLVAGVRLLPPAQRLSERLHGAGRVAAGERYRSNREARGGVQGGGVVAGGDVA